jgi:hypothetical protein
LDGKSLTPCDRDGLDERDRPALSLKKDAGAGAAPAAAEVDEIA